MIDFEFTVEIFSRYHKHLESVEESINRNIVFYQKSVEDLERLVKIKPDTYTGELRKQQEKIKEADIKLSHIIPRMEKLREQIIIICRENNISEIPTFVTKNEAWTSK